MTKWTLLAASAIALAACGQQAQQAETQAPSNYQTPAQTQTAGMSDAQFAQTVANSDAFEIQSSQLAAERAARQDVKDFAAAMVTAHQQTSRELAELAPTLNMTAPTPQLDSTQTSALERLRSATGEGFDDAYLDAQVAAHENAVRTFEGYTQSGNAGPLRDWAQRTLPNLREHLQRAQSLENAT